MRISIETLGTRGDVQPYVALALGLIAAGHQVQIAAPEQFEALVTERAISFAALPGEFLALLDSPEGKAAIAGGQGFSSGLKMLKHVRPLMLKLLSDEWHGVRAFAPDAIVYHPKAIGAPHIANRLGIPFLLASPLPGFTATSVFPSPMLPFANLGPLNRLSHSLAISGADLLFGKLLRQWRAEVLGLPARGRPGRPDGTLYAYSEAVMPRPIDWGPDVLVTGYWFLDTPDWSPPHDLERFLAAGSPPVYIGFGSMPGLAPRAMTAMAIEALAQTGQRGLLASGGGALGSGSLPETALMISAAPHDWLMPHVVAAIHHGGAGTTGAVLRAGVPMAICPFFGDQPFWARRIQALGCGPSPLERKELSAAAIARSISAMAEPEMREAARKLGSAIRREDGVSAAVRFIEGRIPQKIN